MRRRPPTSSPIENMEKGAAKNQLSRICLLALLSAFFWLLLLYFHFVVLGGSAVDDSSQLHTFSVSSESMNTYPVTALPSNSQSTLIHRPSNAQQTPISQPSNAQPTPVSQPSNAQSMPVVSARPRPKNFPFTKALRTVENKSDPCGGRYIYVHDLPPRFNEDMIKECKSLSRWTNMCKFTTNAGLGPPLENVEGVFSDTGWYATNQFTADVIFRDRKSVV